MLEILFIFHYTKLIFGTLGLLLLCMTPLVNYLIIEALVSFRSIKMWVDFVFEQEQIHNIRKDIFLLEPKQIYLFLGRYKQMKGGC